MYFIPELGNENGCAASQTVHCRITVLTWLDYLNWTMLVLSFACIYNPLGFQFPLKKQSGATYSNNYGAQDGFDSLRDLIFFEDEILIE